MREWLKSRIERAKKALSRVELSRGRLESIPDLLPIGEKENLQGTFSDRLLVTECSMKGDVKRKLSPQPGSQVFFPDSQPRDIGSN